MHLFHNRPFAISCAGFIAMSFLCYFLNVELCFYAAGFLLVVALVFLVFYLIRKKRALFLTFLCLTMAFAAALSSALLFHSQYRKYEEYFGKEAVIEGTVLSLRETSYGEKIIEMSLWSFDGNACRDSVRIEYDFDAELNIGDRLRATVTCEEFASTETYDARAAALSDGIFCVMSLESEENLERLERGNFSLRGKMLALRTELAKYLAELIGGEEGNLCVAFLLGDKSLLSGDTVLHFRRVGVSHLLALSGLHVSIIIAFLDFLLKKCRCHRAVRAVAIILFSFAYLFLTGCSLSTVRAVLMSSILMFAFLFRASYDSFTALCSALVFILFLTPWAITDLGMWMSFLAAGSIVAFQPALTLFKERFFEEKKRGMLWKTVFGIIGALFVGAVANLALAPIQGFVFGELPLFSIPATMLLSYPLTAVLFLSSLCLVFPPAAYFCRLVSSFILWCTETLSGIEGILLPLGDRASYCLLFLLSVSLIALAVLKTKRILACFLIPLALTLLLIPSSVIVTNVFFDKVCVEYVCSEIGGGEALLISKGGKCVAVDLSVNSSSAVYALADQAKAARCTEIGDLIFTAYADGDASMLSRLSSSLLIRRIRLPEPKNDWEQMVAEALGKEAALHGIKVLFDMENTVIPQIEDIRLMELPRKAERAPAVLFSFRCGETRLTYTNTAFSENAVTSHFYKDLLQDTEVMVYGGAWRKNGLFYATFPDLRALMLRSEKHKAAFPEELLSRVGEGEIRKYIFE